ncbi:MAG: helix-turn-helix transcriptional regulator [Alphaproteobacteria bacterium]|nr:helix-turn-helix transcriptional regulator [Alphaproteobacteria bacterium]
MFTHEQIWDGLDRLAKAAKLSTSGLAKKGGLDPTSFNKSKRFGPDGKPRWPSTESLNRVLSATGHTMHDFIALVENENATISQGIPVSLSALPVMRLKNAEAQNAFDKNGYPLSKDWEPFDLRRGHSLYALEVDGNNHTPFREGDILLVSPDAPLRRGDRVVLKTTKGEIVIGELIREGGTKTELKTGPKGEERGFASESVSLLARIMWASQ